MAQRLVAAFLALQLGMLPPLAAAFLLDEEYPRLVTDVPFAPGFALLSGDNGYTAIEGRIKKCLRPRGEGCFFKGAWSDPAVLEQLQRFRHVSLAAVADAWLEGGVDKDGVPVKMAKWVEEELRPWCDVMNGRLDTYSKVRGLVYGEGRVFS